MINRNSLLTLIILLAGLAAGYLASREVNNFLAISYTEKDLNRLYRVSGRAPDGVGSLVLRMVDLGGVGVRPDTLDWGGNYEHNQHFFEEVMRSRPPYVDTVALAAESEKFAQYCGHMAHLGFNAIALPWFLEFINFDLLEDSRAVYGETSPYRERHRVLAAAFGEMMETAADSGLATYLWTDMVALTPPLQAYFEDRFGSVDTEDPELWKVYGAAAEEAFRKFPRAKGIIIRIGEAGSVYNMPGWDYFSELYVRSERSVGLMLEAFLAAAAEYDRDIVFRTWSVGVGGIGDMHTNPATYERVLGDIHSEHLVVSTKYCRGDFYSWLELNPTLNQGSQRRILEIQAKREFEGFGALPNYTGLLHQSALQYFMEENPKVEGAWVWTQYGGPLRAGPMIIYPFHGFNVINDANVYALGRLLQEPYAPIDSITAAWISGYFGSDSLLIASLTRFLNASHQVMKSGLYIGEFARYDVKALGLEPPPMMWIFEWNILGASSSVFSNIYYITRNHFQEVLDEGRAAVRGSIAMKEELLEAQALVSRNREAYGQLVAATDYQIELFRLLDYYRQYFMHFYRWLDTGDPGSSARYKLALGQFRAVMDSYEQHYAADLSTLGMDFEEVRAGLEVAENTPRSVRWARLCITVSLFLLLLGIPGIVRDRAGRRFAGSLYFDSLFRPRLISGLSLYHNSSRVAVLMVFLYLLALVVFSAFTSWLFPLVAGGLGMGYVLLLARWIRPARGYSRTLITLMGPRLLTMVLILFFVAVRGPFFFWYRMWVSDLFRLFFFALFIMLLFRRFQVYTLLAGKWSGRRAGFAPAAVFSALGLQLAAAGLLLQLFGLERSLTALNRELLVLPGGLSKILGITTHLGIPLSLPWWILSLGAAMLLITLPVHVVRKVRLHRGIIFF